MGRSRLLIIPVILLNQIIKIFAPYDGDCFISVELNKTVVANGWTDPTPVDKCFPHDEACSTASGLAPGPVVEHFNVIEDIRPGQVPGFVYYLPDAFFL